MSAPKRDVAPSKIIKAGEIGNANLKGGFLRLAEFVKTQEKDKIAQQKIRDKVIGLYRLEKARFAQPTSAKSVFDGLGGNLMDDVDHLSGDIEDLNSGDIEDLNTQIAQADQPTDSLAFAPDLSAQIADHLSGDSEFDALYFETSHKKSPPNQPFTKNITRHIKNR